MRRVWAAVGFAVVALVGCSGAETGAPLRDQGGGTCLTGDTGIKACGNADGSMSYSYPHTTPVACPAGSPSSTQCFLRDGQLMATSETP